MSDKLKTQPIKRVQHITPEAFIKNHVKPQKPLIIEGFIEDWPARTLWSFEYFKSIAGDVEVPLYDSKPITSKYMYNEPQDKMMLEDYIDLLLQKPTDLRIFLFNLIKVRPILQNHIKELKLGLNILKSLPFLFVGGRGSKVFMHYDIDLANILHVHLEGEKDCLLFPPSETKFLYKVPNSLKTHDEIDFLNPDFTKFPALAWARGYHTRLYPGEILYMPEGYWHHMHYKTPGFSISMRSLAKKPKHFWKAIYNISIMRLYENIMRKTKGDGWLQEKQDASISKTHKALNL